MLKQCWQKPSTKLAAADKTVGGVQNKQTETLNVRSLKCQVHRKQMGWKQITWGENN